MTRQEQLCQEWTETAWMMARELGAEFYEKRFAVMQECNFCQKERGIGYIIFTEEGLPKCIFCRNREQS